MPLPGVLYFLYDVAMTLRYDKTASPCAVAKALSPLLQDKMWHDGIKWYSLGQADGVWKSGRNANHLRVLADTIHAELPHTPYWERTRRQAGFFGQEAYGLLRIMREACMRHLMHCPTDLDAPYRLPRMPPAMCLCGNGPCRY